MSLIYMYGVNSFYASAQWSMCRTPCTHTEEFDTISSWELPVRTYGNICIPEI